MTFKTIVPSCYSGRWRRLHFEVFSSIADITDSTNTILTSQITIPQAVCDAVYALDDYAGSAENLAQLTLDTDNIFSNGYDQQLITLNGSVDAGYTSEVMPIPIDTTAEPTAGAVVNDAGGQPPAGDLGTPPTPPTNG